MLQINDFGLLYIIFPKQTTSYTSPYILKQFFYIFFLYNKKKVEIEGLTGEIRFNEDGRRQNYTLHVVEMTVNSAMVKVAEWSDDVGFMPIAAKYVRLRPPEFEINKTYIVTTIIEEPYIMEKVGHEHLEGNDRYEGYCKDLADLVTTKLGINCKLKFYNLKFFLFE